MSTPMKHSLSFKAKKNLMVAFAACGLTLGLDAAAERGQFMDYAKVKSVRPIYRTVEHEVPRRSCWSEDVRVERPYSQAQHHSATSTLVGGLIGGAIGHAVGHGHDNKKIGTAVGTVLGMSIGHDIGHKNRDSRYSEVSYENVERCEVSYQRETEEQLIGYDVTYNYRGETLTTRTREHPGDRIRVSVSVSPVEHY